MSEQLLHCHYMHASIHQARSECVPQCMPRHAVDSRVSTCPSKARLQIDKRFSGLEIVENEFAHVLNVGRGIAEKLVQSRGRVQIRSSTCWLLHILLQEEVAVAVIVWSRGNRAVEDDDLPRVFAVSGPVRKSFAIRVSGFGEAHPIGLHLIREAAIFGAPLGAGSRIERAEDVFEFVGMVGVAYADFDVVGRGGKREEITLNGNAGVDVIFHPEPIAVDQELVGEECGCVDRFFVIRRVKILLRFAGAQAEFPK